MDLFELRYNLVNNYYNKFCSPLFQILFPQFLWILPQENPTIYITIDDSPSAKGTDWLLAIFKDYNVKVTFFCLGRQIALFPDKLLQIACAGHSIGNHSYSHLHAWRVERKEYWLDINNNALLIENLTGKFPTLFRPPYGKFDLRVTKELNNNKVDSVLWSMLLTDWVSYFSVDDAYEYFKTHFQNGCILLLHDSDKSISNLQRLLPLILEYICRNNIQAFVL